MSQFTADVLSLIFGCISIGMSIAIEFPQLISLFKTKNTSGTSISTYVMFIVASILWITWSTLNYLVGISDPSVDMSILHVASLIPAIIGNSINIVLVSIVIYFKVRNVRICKRLKISELQLSKKIFDQQKHYSFFRKYFPLFIIAFLTLLFCLLEVGILYWTFPGFDARVSPTQSDLFHWIMLGVNITAALFFEVVSWPQFIKCMKTKDTSGISLGWAIFFPLSCFVCFSYDLFLAIAGHDVRPVLASLICSGMVINTLVLILKIRNILKSKKLGISEWEYTKRYIDSKKPKQK